MLLIAIIQELFDEQVSLLLIGESGNVEEWTSIAMCLDAVVVINDMFDAANVHHSVELFHRVVLIGLHYCIDR